MNQKNIFSVISVILILQGLAFFFMKNDIAADTFPALDDNAHQALAKLVAVISGLSILVGLITYAVRTAPNVVWAYTLGFAVLAAITYKHKFIDGINVPIVAIVIQVIVLLACVYLWRGEKTA